MGGFGCFFFFWPIFLLKILGKFYKEEERRESLFNGLFLQMCVFVTLPDLTMEIVIVINEFWFQVYVVFRCIIWGVL